MLNGHKTKCPRCCEPLTELTVTYMDYINTDTAGRELLVQKCMDESQLAEISTVYRMYKYSKAYKAQQKLSEDDDAQSSKT